mgnify:CR=1 FL=1
MRIGIPEALYYHDYYPLWEGFYRALGAEVVTSGPTNKTVINFGVESAVDDTCLPVKVFFGHTRLLAPRVDYLFCPRLVSVEDGAYTCPKILGLPDMVEQGLPNLPPLINTSFDFREGRVRLWAAIREAAKPLTRNPWRVQRAWKTGLSRLRVYRELLTQGKTPEEARQECLAGARLTRRGGSKGTGRSGLCIGILGHSYSIYDRYINHDLTRRVEGFGGKVITIDMVPPEILHQEAVREEKPLFWSAGRKNMAMAKYLVSNHQVDGIIQLASFGCGPDSMVAEVVERRVRRNGRVPFMLLNLDEHSGEAGLVTRLEAFMDMVRRRRVG